ncbi:multidrug effflux MFS transporter [Aliiruegeria sabulilitoris]|uniref:multidrug effflux MFS transporter n=1 Tax=Aliiruegeria sabulilitoris TaxID=1510458 RepID=UPI0009EAE34A|nr:multidrug effflux MFS transporter [Aliiruegeria sabulilitoris]NDR58719.1 multidrug effflux MFS transporter [Pseudoruegeria sp. M32A2M]
MTDLQAAAPYQPAATDHKPALPLTEFVALMAVLMATVAFSTDAMLPAFPEISAELSPSSPNRAQLIVAFFLLGLGVGTIFTGPMSDAWGRKPVILGGAVVYIAGAMICWQAGSLEIMLGGRILQGVGGAAGRTVCMAIVRDLYSGRRMSQISSLIMMIFSIVPAMAPTFGAQVIDLAGWRAIFVAFAFVSTIGATWFWLRQPETLPTARRTPLRPGSLMVNTRYVLSMRVVIVAIIVQVLTYGTLFSMISSVLQIFDITYGRGEHFHFWFAGVALLAASSGFLNAKLVNHLGMRFMINAMLVAQITLSSLAALLLWGVGLTGTAGFVVFLVFTLGILFQNGLIAGNATALAMEPVGHLAGLAASAMGAISTILAVLIAIPVGQAFDGTPVPLILCSLTCAGLSFGTMRFLPQRD